MTKVSVIMPIYNVEKYLDQSIKSVINQTLEDIEIICVNDGSTDRSGSIIDKYASIDNRIKVIHKENEGYGKAMNVGLDCATGEYIGIVEPDDYIVPEMYEILYNKAKETNVDVIKADFYRFTGDKIDLVKTYNKLDETNSNYNIVINTKNNLVPFRFIMNTWSGIYNRHFISKYNIRHNETPGASFQDNGFWFQTFMYADTMYFIDKPLYMNRRDNPNSSVKNKEKVYCLTNEYKFIRSIIDNNPELYKYIGVYWVAKFKNYIFNLTRIDQVFHNEFLKLFVEEFNNAKDKNEIDFELFKSENLLDPLKQLYSSPTKFYNQILHKKSLLEKIFSIKNHDDNTHKVLTILGIQIKFKSSKLVIKNIQNQLNSLMLVVEQQKCQLNKIDSNLIIIKNQNNTTYKYLSQNILQNIINSKFEYERCKEFYNDIQKLDFVNSYKSLIKNLDDDSVQCINKVLARVELISKNGLPIYNLYDKNELSEIDNINKNFYPNIIKLSDNCFAYKKYLLPINHFEPSVFYYKNNIDVLTDFNKIREKNIIDVGGYIGDSAIIFSDYTNKHIYSFEPTTENLSLMNRTIEINELKNKIIPVNMALGSKNEEQEIYLQGSGSSVTRVIEENPVKECIKITTLDDFVQNNCIEVGLIKVDIEGFEQEFLKGAINTIKTQKPTLILSIYHYADDFFKIKPMIESLNIGYNLRVIKPIGSGIRGEIVLICE